MVDGFESALIAALLWHLPLEDHVAEMDRTWPFALQPKYLTTKLTVAI